MFLGSLLLLLCVLDLDRYMQIFGGKVNYQRGKSMYPSGSVDAGVGMPHLFPHAMPRPTSMAMTTWTSLSFLLPAYIPWQIC